MFTQFLYANDYTAGRLGYTGLLAFNLILLFLRQSLIKNDLLNLLASFLELRFGFSSSVTFIWPFISRSGADLVPHVDN